MNMSGWQRALRARGKWLTYYLRHPLEAVRPRKDIVVRATCGVRYLCSYENYIEREIMSIGAFEPDSTRVIESIVKPGDIVFDIGANVGYYSLLMTKQVGPTGAVHCFEPTAYAFERLNRNVNLNGDLPMEALHLNRTGLMAAPENSVRRIESQFSAKILARAQAEQMQFTTLDAYCDERSVNRVDFIKIDVDGYDYAAMLGGVTVLKKWHPKLLCELNAGALAEQKASLKKYLGLLLECGYDECHVLGPVTTKMTLTSAMKAMGPSTSTNALICAS